MKNILLFFAFIFLLQTVNAQYVTIPDSNLRVRLKELYPSCFDVNDRMDTTCDQVVNERDLFLDGYFITSLEGIEYFRNLRELWCPNNYLTSLPVLPKTLKRLICNNNRLSSLPVLPELLEDLTCSHNLLTSLPELPVLLNKLWCENNQLTVLPSLPTAIKSIFCRDNQLTSLPMLPATLDLLVCNNNQLTSLPSLPDFLTNLYCENNRLTFLPELPPSIYGLYCYNNQLSSLPELPPALVDLYCYNNQITILPELSSSLINLYCSNNRLTTLPKLPNQLEKLFCDNNKIKFLPILSESIQNLSCSYNQLTSLPVLPSSLREFDCSHNQLTCLPALPGTMYTMNCSYNQLTALPVFTFLSSLFCNNNPLYCLPVLPNGLEELIIKNTRISCMPNVPLYFGYADTILPICTNASDVCPVNPFVQGIIYNDINNNGIFDAVSEQLMSQQIVKALPNNWLGTSDENGIYWLKLDTVINNSWSLINDNDYVTITPNAYSLANINTLGLQSGSYDFGVHFIQNVKDIETTLGASPARPGFTANITITVNNVGTVNQSNITIKLKMPTRFNVLSTSVTPTSTIDDTLIWNNVSINYLEHQSINVQLQVPVTAVLGDSAIYEVWANGTQGDTTPVDNYSQWVEVIRGSFDPNDKLVNTPALPSTYNAEKDRLLYTIRFQNTGTDTAFTVIVRDIVPENLDISSLRVVNASHPYQLIVREKNIVEVVFPNIQLPDSNTNEAKSHGFVQLEFKPKAGLPLNAEINNNASIFFDYNLPVITNTATTKVQIVTGIPNNKKLSFKLFPNPTSEKITVELPYSGNGKWLLTDISGKTIKQSNIENNTSSFDVNVNDIANGTYLFSFELNDVISSSKVIIIR